MNAGIPILVLLLSMCASVVRAGANTEADDFLLPDMEEIALPGDDPSGKSITLRVQPEGLRTTAVGNSGEERQNLITVNLSNVPLREVIQMFARVSGANIITGTNFEERVSVNLKEVEWEPALRLILGAANKAMVEKAPGMFVAMSKNDMLTEPLSVVPIFLRFVTVDDVLPIVRSMISTNGAASGFSSANALVVQETSARLEMIRDVITEIDRPLSQVCIEAKFVELNDQAIEDIGVNWEVLSGYTIGAGSLGLNYSETRRKTSQDAIVESGLGQSMKSHSAIDADTGDSRTDSEYSSESVLQATLGGQNYTEYDAEENKVTLVPSRERTEIRSAILSADEFALTLSALKQNDGVEIVSNPKVVVSSGSMATIHVGRNEPNIVALPQGDAGDRYAYSLDCKNPFIEIGVKLEVVATVNTESNISIRITPELSRKLADKVVGDAGISFPVTQIRRIETEFNLESGRTVAIGGLTTSEEVENVKRIPFLGRIPILGKYLFSHTHTQEIQDEVIVFVTVQLANPQSMEEYLGIPSRGALIHRFLARELLEEEGPGEENEGEGEEERKKEGLSGRDAEEESR